MIRRRDFAPGLLAARWVSLSWRSLGVVGVGTLLISWSLEQVHFVTSEPSRLAVALSLAVLVLAWRAAVLPAVAYALLGALTLFWSLAPGDTLRAIPWELPLLAGFVVGRQPGAPWALAVLVGTLGSSSLALYGFGLQSYHSGTPVYLAGAVSASALALLWNPLRLRGRAGWLVRGALAALPLYLVTVSGSRAVYLGALVAVLLVFGQALSRRGLQSVLALAGTVLVATVLAGGVDLAMPESPVELALGRKASVEAQTGAVSEYGGGTQRLRFWAQALDVALEHPLGAGAGSFPAVVHSHQRFPMTWSNSPHNVFFETLANGGWPRLVLLVSLIFWSLVRAFRRGDVAAAAAALSIWIFLSFDVASYYPGFLALAFLLTGTAWGRVDGEVKFSRPIAAVGTTCVAAVGIGAFLWWSANCSTERCVLARKLGAPSDVVEQLQRTPDEARPAFLARVEALYPESLWVVRLRERHAATVDERLAVQREIVERFPLQHPENYTRLAETALAAGRPAQAEEALRKGLMEFPPDRRPFSEMRYSAQEHALWAEQAQALLAELEAR